VTERWIFLDLDGPVLDVSYRYHRVHRDVVEELGGTPLTRAAYWEAKRDRIPETEILARTGLAPEAAAQAAAERLRRIEDPRYLSLDRPWPWVAEILDELARLGRLALVTLRNHPDRLEEQLGALGLTRRFERVIAARGDGTPMAKAALLRRSGISWAPGSVLVGDTEVDVASGRALELRTAALGCGIRSPALLEPWSPDALLGDLRQVPGWLAEIDEIS
jgi:phosphoglycolate phosphatase